jgi:hypothetical protein
MEALHAAVKTELGEDELPTGWGAEVPAAEHGHGWLVNVKGEVKTEINIRVNHRDTLVNVEIKSETSPPGHARAPVVRPSGKRRLVRVSSGSASGSCVEESLSKSTTQSTKASAVVKGIARGEGYIGALAAEVECRGLVRRDNSRSSRHTGVSWEKDRRKWVAKVRHGGKRESLGYFDSEEEAKARYDARCQELGMDPDAATSSGFRGVAWNKAKSRWLAQITVDGKKKGLGLFEGTAGGEVDTALAFDIAARAAGRPEKANFEPASGDLSAAELSTQTRKRSRDDAGWAAQLAKLKAYKRRHGDCGVPQSWSADPRLGRWVSNQRQYKKAMDRGESGPGKTGMTAARVSKLDALGFAWWLPAAEIGDRRNQRNRRGHDAGWERWLVKLKAYKREHGDCNVPSRWGNDPRLGRWVSKQRTGKSSLDRGEPSVGMTAARAAKLDTLGFAWSLGTRPGPGYGQRK